MIQSFKGRYTTEDENHILNSLPTFDKYVVCTLVYFLEQRIADLESTVEDLRHEIITVTNMTNTPTFSSDPIPGPAVPDGYTALGPGHVVQTGDRFLSSDGFWKRTEMDGTKLPFGGLEYARPDPVTLILENERRVVATANRVPALLQQISDLERTVREQAGTIADLEDRGDKWEHLARAREDNDERINDLETEIRELKRHLYPRG